MARCAFLGGDVEGLGCCAESEGGMNRWYNLNVDLDD